MVNKLKYLTMVSFKRKVITKWFVIANVLLALVLVGLFNIDSIINYFGGDFTSNQQIYVIDNTGKSYDIFVANMQEITKATSSVGDYKYDISNYDGTLKEAKDKIAKDKKIWLLVFDNDATNIIKATVVSYGYIDTINYQLLASSINSTKSVIALAETSISEEDLAKIMTAPTITREYVDVTKKTTDENMEMIMSTVFPMLILPFFMLTILLVQMIGAEVNDEKTTRSMEIIISNVSPKTHFFAKVIAGNLFVLVQALLLLVYAGIGFVIKMLTNPGFDSNGVTVVIFDSFKQIMKTNLADKLLYIIPLTLILMLITFIAYSLVAGILASMTTNIEDFQQLQTPIMIVSVIGYYLSMMAALFDGSILIKALSFVPFISAILSPSLLVLGYIGVKDVLISILLMMITVHLLIKYGLRIYKVGILNYSSSGLWKKMFTALKD